MHARSALFDVYGDHLRNRGGCAPIAALVELLAPLDINPPAVRTAVSRMVRQGWLRAIDVAGQRGYALTTKAMHRLDDSAARIYRTRHKHWDGALDLLMFEPPSVRRLRSQLSDALRFHGYGPLYSGTWLSPWPQDNVAAIFDEANVNYERFHSTHCGDTAALVHRAWNLDELAKQYREFVSEMESVVRAVTPQSSDEIAYTARCYLVHAFRVFLFSDPQLPIELCPPQWAGGAAATFFDTYAAKLRPAADRYVDRCLLAK